MKLVQVPGKLVLVGEYAVLDGGGAVVAAVDRGVECRVSPGPMAIEAPGDTRFVRAALQGAPPARYVFSDWNPVIGIDGKPGFGGSAAATVAAVLVSGQPADRAFAVHAAVQGGGSGVDVFASVHGGVTHFPSAQPRPCPALVAVWAGASAATAPRVARYQAWAGRRAFVDRSRALVEAFGAEPVRVVEEAYALLCGMARDAGLDYDTPVFRAVAGLARGRGGAAKPSGAGGGDVAVAVFPDEGRLASFVGACGEAGLLPISVRVAPAPQVRSLSAG